MKHTNPLETQLRSWTPRRPSAALERRLFGRARHHGGPRAVLGWLVPATACLLVACMSLNQQSRLSVAELSAGSNLVAVIMSNQSYAAYLPGSFQPQANRVDTFEWTNGSYSTSSMHSLSPGRTND